MVNEILSKLEKINFENKLEFIDDTHEYFIEDKKSKLTSVTTLLSEYFPFDADKIAEFLAGRRFVSKEEILDEWRERQEYGSFIHNTVEDYIKNKKPSNDSYEHIRHGIEFLNSIQESHEIIGSEIVVFNSEFNIAGTIDLIIKEKETGKILTIDWKTGQKDIEKNDVWDYCKSPLNEIPNNKFYKYSMQLCMYNMILKETYGIDIWDSYILHLRDDGENYDKHECINLDYEVELILREIKNKENKQEKKKILNVG